MSIFKSCDVRGIVGEEWDVDDARRIGRSLGSMLHRRNQTRICVGGDFRRSTNRLKAALIEGLRQLGVDVVDVGQVPTPVVAFAARQFGCANLAIVTASHNPGKYNGIKFLVDGQPPIPALMAELQDALGTAGDRSSGGYADGARRTGRITKPGWFRVRGSLSQPLVARSDIVSRSARARAGGRGRRGRAASTASRRGPHGRRLYRHCAARVGRGRL